MRDQDTKRYFAARDYDIARSEKILISMNRNESLDLIRIFAFICVVFLHLGATVSFQSTPLASIMNVFARFGVPFFFAVTGYFIVNADVFKMGRSIRKEIRFTLFAVLFYVVLSLCGLWNWSGTNLSLIDFLKSNWVESFLAWNSFPFAYHLWFLFAALYTYAVLIVWKASGCTIKFFLVLGAVLLVLRLVLTEFTGNLNPLGAEPRSALFFALPAFALGMAFRLMQGVIKRIPIAVSVALFLIGFFVALIEGLLFGLQELYIGSIIMVFGVFALCERRPHPFSSDSIKRVIGFLTRFGGLPTGIAYVVHLAILQFTLRLFAIDPLLASMTVLLAVWMGSSMISLILGYICAYLFSLEKKKI